MVQPADFLSRLPVLRPPRRLETERLRLRPWTDADLAPFAELNADPEVMEHFEAPLRRAQSDELAHRIRSLIDERGWGFWAVELQDSQEFIGFTGLHAPLHLPFGPCVEVGWRLARRHWGKGYATEAARTALAFGFETLRLQHIVAFTPTTNSRSMAVMQRLGMKDSGRNFLHPDVAPGHKLEEHVLYVGKQPS